MPVSGGVESLCEKIYARMLHLRRGGGEVGDKDDLLEYRFYRMETKSCNA